MLNCESIRPHLCFAVEVPTNPSIQNMKTKQLETPVSLSESPYEGGFHLPAYDWNKQSRNMPKNGGNYTARSVQTFDYKGNPCDADSDRNDT